MKKKFRPLVIALGALILVGAAYLLIVKLIPPPPEEALQAENAPSPIVITELGIVTEVSALHP